MPTTTTTTTTRTRTSTTTRAKGGLTEGEKTTGTMGTGIHGVGHPRDGTNRGPGEKKVCRITTKDVCYWRSI